MDSRGLMAGGSGAPGGTRVLVVEDDDAIRMLIRELLTDAGYAVGEARSGREGLERASELDPHLIILDKRMPDVDGEQFAAEYRARRGPHAPIVALSAAADAEAWARRIHAAAYISKPLDIEELLRVVDAQTGKRR